jgi:hypothetical protein
VGMANIGKQLERAITDNLKERGYSHYSYENYIIIGNNLVAAELIYSTIKKQLIVDIRYVIDFSKTISLYWD